jgi:hypothetical protein
MDAITPHKHQEKYGRLQPSELDPSTTPTPSPDSKALYIRALNCNFVMRFDRRSFIQPDAHLSAATLARSSSFIFLFAVMRFHSACVLMKNGAVGNSPITLDPRGEFIGFGYDFLTRCLTAPSAFNESSNRGVLQRSLPVRDQRSNP